MISSRADLLPKLKEVQMRELELQQSPEVQSFAADLGYRILNDNGIWIIYRQDPYGYGWTQIANFATLSDAKNALRRLKVEEDNRYDNLAEQRDWESAKEAEGQGE